MNKYHISYEIFFCDCGTTKIVSNNTEPESKQMYSSPGSNKDPNSDQQFYYKIIQGPSHRNVSLHTLLHTKKKKNCTEALLVTKNTKENSNALQWVKRWTNFGI